MLVQTLGKQPRKRPSRGQAIDDDATALVSGDTGEGEICTANELGEQLELMSGTKEDINATEERFDPLKDKYDCLEKFEKLKLERRKEVDAEADLFLDELKQRGISKEKFKQMLPKDMELDEIKERGKKPWILTILNYLLPVEHEHVRADLE